MPQEKMQTLRYDDGTGDELAVPLGGTSFVSGRVMFHLLPPPLQSLAVRAKVQYSPHPYVWMGSAKSRSTGLGMESDGTELSREDLPPFSEDKIKVYPMLWKNSVTGGLHLQVHPSGVESLVRRFVLRRELSLTAPASKRSSTPSLPVWRPLPTPSTPAAHISPTLRRCATCSIACNALPSPPSTSTATRGRPTTSPSSTTAARCTPSLVRLLRTSSARFGSASECSGCSVLVLSADAPLCPASPRVTALLDLPRRTSGRGLES